MNYPSAEAVPLSTLSKDYQCDEANVPVHATAVEVPLRGLSRVLLSQQKSKVMNGYEIEALRDQGFTSSLAKAMTQNNAAFPLRIWVVDNSGSMAEPDGHRVVDSKNRNDVKFVPCTRWTEIQQTVDYHAQMAALLQAPTVFRLLNDPGRAVGPQQFSIAESGVDNLDQEIAQAKHIMLNASPSGPTPLVYHINEIRKSVLQLEPSLRAEGTKVAIILATDGLPTDDLGRCNSSSKQELVNAMRSLEGLPVWLVVRLCTDEEQVVDFYNDLDSQLEYSVDVLDDFIQEAAEVYKKNKWLNYALPLHRCREMGIYSRLFDLLDERQLTLDEIQQMLKLLLGDSVMNVDPQSNKKGFLQHVSALLQQEPKQWNPVSKKLAPWVDIHQLSKICKGKKKGCAIM